MVSYRRRPASIAEPRTTQRLLRRRVSVLILVFHLVTRMRHGVS